MLRINEGFILQEVNERQCPQKIQKRELYCNGRLSFDQNV